MSSRSVKHTDQNSTMAEGRDVKRALARFSPGGLAQLVRVPWPVNLLGAALVLVQVYLAIAFVASLVEPG
ncbi:hypothetical protein EDD29_0501 [Actinocorallia herbida]|uniref:Uncharacterized protein n=1 Tax=Actinocorallia herbida TaxID=58109 RepID=A0A3N1CP10_9ACTN|nr:hypothetical protein [Actinocorallia herbida]ROO83013.1 hypothetical protein EDD29_0501 [Actinocorallia herbida]